MYLSIVIPFLNEEESLQDLYNQIIAVVSEMKKSFEIIFVDDGSTDDSIGVMDSLCQQDERVKLIQFQRNFGKAAALAAGFKAATGDVVVTMDAELQDDPKEIPNLLEKLDEGYDLVSGWKKVRHDPLSKRLASKVYNYFTSIMSGIRLHDFNCGLKGYRQEVIKTLTVYGDFHRYLPVMAFHNGFRVTEIPVTHHARKFGKTKFGADRFTRGAFDLITITFLSKYRKRPLHFFGLFGMISTLLGVAILGFLSYERIVKSVYLSDRPILFLGVLLVIVGVQFFSIGLIGEMLTSNRETGDTFFVKRTEQIDRKIFD